MITNILIYCGINIATLACGLIVILFWRMGVLHQELHDRIWAGYAKATEDFRMAEAKATKQLQDARRQQRLAILGGENFVAE